jgi:hypothetical protein
MTKKDLMTSYEHRQCGLNRCGNPELFIQKWTSCNNGINVKDDMENYPDVDKCPQIYIIYGRRLLWKISRISMNQKLKHFNLF